MTYNGGNDTIKYKDCHKSNPLKLTAKNTANGIGLSWNKDSSAELYEIYRSTEKNKNKALVAKVSARSYTDKSAKDGKRYIYSVIPFDKKDKKGSSSTADPITKLSPPTITEYSNTRSGIKLSWSKSEGATSYRVFRKTNDGKKWKQMGKTNGKTLTFTDKKVSPENNYTYIVKAYTKGSASYRSNHVKADFTSSPEIVKFNLNKKSVCISWEKSPKAAAYEIYRTGPDSKKLEFYQKFTADTLSFTDKNVRSGKKYGYAVRSINASGKKSALLSAEYCLIMKTPKIKKAENTTKGIKLTWSKTPKAESYNIYRSEDGTATWKKILNTKKTSATDTSVLNAKKYVYTVRAVYNGTQSNYVKDGFSACYLSAPSNVAVEFISKTSNRITWAETPGATRYNVYRRLENSTEWTRVKRTSKTSYTDNSIETGKIYAYFVRAYIKTDYKSAASHTVYSSIVNPKGKMVALTYDDGPSNIITNRVLDILQKYDSRATFFVVGSRIDANFAPMKRAVGLGCEIGNHTYNHINLPSHTKETIETEINATNNLVKKYTGIVPKLARAPGGSTSDYSREIVNMPFIYWSIDTRDWETLNANSVIAHVKNETRDGSIILMHDIYQSTADASEVIIPWLINQGYQLVTVSELMHYKGIELKNGVTYYNAYI